MISFGEFSLRRPLFLDNNAPVYGAEGTYTKTYVTVVIPDVKCDRCALQLMNPMTDKLAQYGMTNCTYDPTCTQCNDGFHCFSNYHSCANVRITGSVPRYDDETKRGKNEETAN